MTPKKIFIIHGWTYTLNRWELLFEELKSLGHEPVMLKVPGLSEPSDAVWDIPKYVEWLDSQLEGVQHPIVVGHSNGGRIAMAYDVKHPQRIKHLFLIASAGIYNDARSVGLKRRVFGLVAKIIKPFVRGKLRKVIYRAIGATDYGNATPSMRKTMINITNHDKTFDIGAVSSKTSLIWGADDLATPLSDARKLEQKLQNFNDIIVFQGIKHSPHADVPKEVAQFIHTRSKAS